MPPPHASRLLVPNLAISRMEGELATLSQQDAALTNKVGAAKARLAVRDEVTSVLELLQQKANERTVGVQQRLLTAILHDVFPDNPAEVKLELSTERGSPSLDVELETAGHRENVFEANGGAMTNVISTGLRYVALNQLSTYRKFVLLDEPDCWISPNNIPEFVGVLAKLADTVHIQTVLVTHHDLSLLPQGVSVVRMEPDGDGTKASVVLKTADWDETRPGLRYLKLTDARRHKDLAIPLFPGVTVISGPNNVGKSVLGAALTAIAYGDSNDTLIRHGADSCRIEVGLESDLTLEFTRKRKGTPKAVCALRKEGMADPLHEEPVGRGTVPDWVTSTLGIQRAGELNIQLGHQKSPVFLLDEKSPSVRASILSVGKEAGHLHAMMDSYQEMVKQDRETSARGEREIYRLREKIGALAPLPAFRAELATLEAAGSALDEQEALLSRQSASAVELERATSELARLSSVQSLMRGLPQLPQLEDEAVLQALLRDLPPAKRTASMAAPPAPRVPELVDTRELEWLIREMAQAAKRTEHAARLKLLVVPALPVLDDAAPLAEIITRLEKASSDVAANKFHKGLLTEELADIEKEWGVCPTCHSLLQGTAHAHN